MSSFLPTDEERRLMNRSVLLPMVLKQVEQARMQMYDEKNSLKRRIYLITAELLVRRLKLDIANMKQELLRKEIKVVNPSENGYAFVCRAQHVNAVDFKPDQLRRAIQDLLNTYIDNLGHDLTALGTK